MSVLSRVYSVTEAKGIADTRFIELNVSPTRVAVGKEVKITGKLQTHSFLLCTWPAFYDAPVDLYVDATKVAGDITKSDGSFEFKWYPKDLGRFWLKVRFDGDLLHNASESVSVAVDVITEEEKAKEDQTFWFMVGGLALAGVACVGIVAYTITEERRMQMLMAARKG
jgi:hypothetical protein